MGFIRMETSRRDLLRYAAACPGPRQCDFPGDRKTASRTADRRPVAGLTLTDMTTVLHNAKLSEAGAAAFDPSGGDALAFAAGERVAGRQAAIVSLVSIDGRAPR